MLTRAGKHVCIMLVLEVFVIVNVTVSQSDKKSSSLHECLLQQHRLQ